MGLVMMRKAEIEEILPLLKDRNWEVRWSAAYALGRVGDRKALAALSPVAEKDPYFDAAAGTYPVREAAARAIKRLNAVIGWRTDPERTLASARQAGKPVLIYFRKTGSDLCRRFEEAVFTDEKLIDAVQRFVPIWADHLACPGLFHNYRIAKVPSLVLISKAGKRTTIRGTLGEDALQKKLLAVLEPEGRVFRLRSRLEENPEDPELNWQLAEFYMDEGMWEPALGRLAVIIEKDPDNLSSLLDNALFARAYIRGQVGQFDQAYRELEELIARFPSFGDRAEAVYCYGLSAFKTGKIEEGKKILRGLKQDYPDTSFARMVSFRK